MPCAGGAAAASSKPHKQDLREESCSDDYSESDDEGSDGYRKGAVVAGWRLVIGGWLVGFQRCTPGFQVCMLNVGGCSDSYHERVAIGG
eukprot:365616-Chlamydomonas_euryale.AAC.4